MSPLLLETIQIKNGKIIAPEYHTERINRSCFELFGINNIIKLEDIVKVPPAYASGIYKCRIIYNNNEIISVEFIDYEIKMIRSLKVVYDNNIDYSCKRADRSELESLFSRKGPCDDILIVKNGYVTDSFSANCVFINEHETVTPEKPLLHGTMRQQLLDKNEIDKKAIRMENICEYKEVKLINAFRTLKEPGVKIENIIW